MGFNQKLVSQPYVFGFIFSLDFFDFPWIFLGFFDLFIFDLFIFDLFIFDRSNDYDCTLPNLIHHQPRGLRRPNTGSDGSTAADGRHAATDGGNAAATGGHEPFSWNPQNSGPEGGRWSPQRLLYFEMWVQRPQRPAAQLLLLLLLLHSVQGAYSMETGVVLLMFLFWSDCF